MAVTQEFLNTLKDKLNIIDVASSYVSLEKKGGSYWACCPFHHEKTPSFAISESDQFYHCFGCGASGDIIKFVREMENIDFMEAVKLLADRAKLPMPETDKDSDKTFELKKKKDTLLRLLKDTAHFYLDNLNSGNADAHIEYILKRQIPANIVRTFGLGASLDYNTLPRFLHSKGYTKQEMLDSGVINEVDGRLVDALGGRLIFPIINAMDDVIGFCGRVLKKTDFAKYKNTKDTIIFNKRKNLYNINLLKKLKRSQTIKEVIMVEGQMDTLSLYMAGFKNVVASMGTSLTQEQARLIKRYTDTVLISYDGDGAGQKANMRGLEILKEAGLNVKVVPLPEGPDPDDIIKAEGPEGYQRLLDQAMPLIDYKLLTLKKSFNLSKTEEKRKYVSEAIKIIRTSPSAAEQEELLKTLRSETGVTFEALNRELLSQPVEQETTKQALPVRQDNADKYVKASRFVLAAYLFNDRYIKDIPIQSIPFVSDTHRVLARYIYAKQMMEEKLIISELFDLFTEGSSDGEELSAILDYNDGERLEGPVNERFFFDSIVQLKHYDIEQRIEQVKAKIKTVTDINERTQYVQELARLIATQKKN